ncbi:MAG TPA: hypothetical protein PLU30_23285 [Verrucomicrobiae bacterium]|nr:hypothetical protein [Verrucomicrobiae bacterium]
MPQPKKVDPRPVVAMPDRPDLPLSWAKFAPAIDAFVPPTGTFDPAGTWDMRWRILVTVGGMAGGAQPGTLRIQRQPGPSGTAKLAFETQVTLGGLQRFSMTGTLSCAPDALTSVTTWEMESTVQDIKGGPIESTRVRERGTATTDGAEIDRAGKKFRLAAKPPLTSNWSLFDAVQRLSPDAAPGPFGMLEDLALLRHDQRISPDETRVLSLGGKAMRLRSFVQIGDGILPTHYWLDESGRLIFASCGLRGYMLDAAT